MRHASSAAALVGGSLAVLAVVPGGAVALSIGLVGLGLLALGVGRARRRLVTAGSALLFAGVLVAGATGLAPGLALFGTLFAIVAWDAGIYPIGLDEQVGADARTARAELVHVGATVAAGGTLASVAHLAAVAGMGRFPPLAAIAVVAGAWLLAMGLEPLADPETRAL